MLVTTRCVGGFKKPNLNLIFRVKCQNYTLAASQIIPGNNDVQKDCSVAPQWKLMASVCIMRLPVVTKELSQLEKDYNDLKEQEEFEKSVYSDWEVEKMRQAALMKEVQAGRLSPHKLDFKVTRQQIEDENELNLEKYLKNKKETKVDNTSLQNINRHLDQTLTLIIKKNLGNNVVWGLPWASWQNGETMKDCALRALTNICDDNTKAVILSNAPSTFYKYKLPKEARKDNSDMSGIKEFVYNAVVSRVDCTDLKQAPDDVKILNKLDNSILEYAWATETELKSFLKPKYFNVLEKVIL